MAKRESKSPAWFLPKIQNLLEQKDSEGLVEYLQPGYHHRVRIAALNALAEIGDKTAIGAMGEILRNDSEALLDEISQKLAPVPGDETLAALAVGLSSDNVFTRSMIARIVAQREEHSVFTYLVRVSRDLFPAVSRLGKRLLRNRVRDFPAQLQELRPESLDGVMEELPFDAVWSFLPRQTSHNIRQAAIKRMAYFDSEDAVNFLISTALAAEAPFYELALEAIETNQSVTAEDIQPILEWGSEELYDRAFTCFARRTGPERLEFLIQALQHDHSKVRTEAVNALFRLFGQKIVPVLTQLLIVSNNDPVVCGAVLDAIEDSPRSMVEEPLIMATTKGPRELRIRALTISAKMGICTPQLIGDYLSFLDKALKDPRPEGAALDNICNTFTALQEARPVYLLVSLILATRSPSPRLRRVAMGVLGKYPQEQRLEAYTYLQNVSDLQVVKAIAFEMAKAKHPEAKIPLIRVAMGRNRKDSRVARRYLRQMPELRNIEGICGLVKSPHPEVKQYGIDRLKEMGDPQAVAMLLQAMESGDKELQQRALERLAELGNQDAQELAEGGDTDAITEGLDRDELEQLSEEADPRAVDILIEAANDADEMVQLSAVDALGKFMKDERVVKRIIEFINYGGVPVRQKAVEILGKNKVMAAVDPLISALGNIFLRSYAEEALRNIGDRRGYLAVLRRRKREKIFPSRAKLEREKLQRLSGKSRKKSVA